ncbi:MAG: FHA domain-containing protein [Armatimonadetes bacterium]|nr:FHA domain-containing protein [Armatimonadota bacterium]MCX7968767.1 FHA domain-containing protein [Armatimonadota bacterium]MDW8143448.1 FHA domain-containing protein [Armatimonadota bacterium]
MGWQQRFAQLTGRACARALFGAIGGLVAWLLVEPFTTDVKSIQELFEVNQGTPGNPLWALVGAFIGISIVGLEELLWGSKQKALRSVLVTGILGVFGGSFAFSLGSWVFNLFGSIVLRYPEGDPMQFFWLMVARSLTWALVGALLGLALGAARKSWKGALNSAIGGLIGGFAGGVFFDTIAPQIGFILTLGLVESGWASRLIGLVSIGALIGLFSTIAEQLLSPASLKVISSGRMEGRQFIVDKPVVTIGRDERCDVALYYDRDVAMKHALLKWDGRNYAIMPEGNATVFVNNQTVRHQQLKDGDVITVGQTRLLFRTHHAVVAVQKEAPAQKVCPSCGTLNRATAKFCHQCGRGL